jgi:hypothetical protein
MPEIPQQLRNLTSAGVVLPDGMQASAEFLQPLLEFLISRQLFFASLPEYSLG